MDIAVFPSFGQIALQLVAVLVVDGFTFSSKEE